jgi:hypothetical protein
MSDVQSPKSELVTGDIEQAHDLSSSSPPVRS